MELPWYNLSLKGSCKKRNKFKKKKGGENDYKDDSIVYNMRWELYANLPYYLKGLYLLWDKSYIINKKIKKKKSKKETKNSSSTSLMRVSFYQLQYSFLFFLPSREVYKTVSVSSTTNNRQLYDKLRPHRLLYWKLAAPIKFLFQLISWNKFLLFVVFLFARCFLGIAFLHLKSGLTSYIITPQIRNPDKQEPTEFSAQPRS